MIVFMYKYLLQRGFSCLYLSEKNFQRNGISTERRLGNRIHIIHKNSTEIYGDNSL